VVAATFLVQLTAALIGKLSPSLPVLIVGIPLKTLTGYVVLMASLSLWPRFIDSRFSALLDAGMHLLVNHARR
jgi:flagellar biosynthetic protein FliR